MKKLSLQTKSSAQIQQTPPQIHYSKILQKINEAKQLQQQQQYSARNNNFFSGFRSQQNRGITNENISQIKEKLQSQRKNATPQNIHSNINKQQQIDLIQQNQKPFYQQGQYNFQSQGQQILQFTPKSQKNKSQQQKQNLSNNKKIIQSRINFSPITPLEDSYRDHQQIPDYQTPITQKESMLNQINFQQTFQQQVPKETKIQSKLSLYLKTSGNEQKQQKQNQMKQVTQNQQNKPKNQDVSNLTEEFSKNLSTISNFQNNNLKNFSQIQQTINCFNCSDKKATYLVQMEDSEIIEDQLMNKEDLEDNQNEIQQEMIFYCTKCALVLAQQGIQVQIIDEMKLNIKGGKSNQTINSPDGKTINSMNFQQNENLQQQSQSNLFINNKFENLTLEEQQKKQDLENFSQQVNKILINCNKVNSHLQKRSEEVEEFYEKQMKKIEKFYSLIVESVQQEKEQGIQYLKENQKVIKQMYSKYEEQTGGIMKDLEGTFVDVNQNMENILKSMEQEPFQMILRQYGEKLQKYEQFLERLQEDNLMISKINICSNEKFQDFKQEKIIPLLKDLFGTCSIQARLVKMNEKIGFQSMGLFSECGDTQEIKNKKEFEQKDSSSKEINKGKGSIYISFENKDMFENAIKQSLNYNRKIQEEIIEVQQENSQEFGQNNFYDQSQMQQSGNFQQQIRTLSIMDMQDISQQQNQNEQFNKRNQNFGQSLQIYENESQFIRKSYDNEQVKFETQFSSQESQNEQSSQELEQSKNMQELLIQNEKISKEKFRLISSSTESEEIKNSNQNIFLKQNENIQNQVSGKQKIISLNLDRFEGIYQKIGQEQEQNQIKTKKYQSLEGNQKKKYNELLEKINNNQKNIQSSILINQQKISDKENNLNSIQINNNNNYINSKKEINFNGKNNFNLNIKQNSESSVLQNENSSPNFQRQLFLDGSPHFNEGDSSF